MRGKRKCQNGALGTEGSSRMRVDKGRSHAKNQEKCSSTLLLHIRLLLISLPPPPSTLLRLELRLLRVQGGAIVSLIVPEYV